MRRILVIPNLLKPDAIQLAQRVVDHLRSLDLTACVLPEAAHRGALNRVTVVQEADMATVDLAVVLGGDGTILRCVHRLRVHDIPILGINLGRIGYLTECEPGRAIEAIDQVTGGDYSLQPRILLGGTVLRQGQQKHPFVAFNEVSVHRASVSRMPGFAVAINGVELDRFYADGVLIATPTGSTAYNLSAGGPILVPTADNMVITPVSPHALSGRSVVASGEDSIEITLVDCPRPPDEEGDHPQLTVDGDRKLPLLVGDTVCVNRARQRVHFIKLGTDHFYRALREKLFRHSDTTISIKP